MLFPAPQSWNKARAKPHQARLDMQGQPATGTEDAVTQSRVASHQVAADAHNQAKAPQRPSKVADTRLKHRMVTRVEAGNAL
jgi:hypothetical protein